MAERIVSPGVFTQENDLSFLPAGIGEIGAVIIGRTEIGPAFQPTIIRSMNDFELQFGSSTAGTYVPYTVKEYIRSAGAVTIVRVLGLDGYNISGQVFIHASGSATFASNSSATANTDKHLLAVMHATADDPDQECSAITYGTTGGQQFASASIFLSTQSGAFPAESQPLFAITSSDDLRYRFIGIDAPSLGAITNDINTGAGSTSTVYFLSQSDPGLGALLVPSGSNNMLNAVAAIQSVQSNLGIAATLGTSQSTAEFCMRLDMTASSAGDGENAIRFVTQSGAAYGSALAFTGGVSASGSGDLSDALTGAGVATFTWHTAVASTWSFDKANANYFEDQLPMEAGAYIPGVETGTETYVRSFYVHSLFNSQSYGTSADNKGGGYAFNRASASIHAVDFDAVASSTSTGTNSSTSGKSYSAASTPWVVGQTIGGATNDPLIKFHTLAHGNQTNQLCKVSIVAIKAGGTVSGQDYGSFTVTVRKFDDTDTKVVALESYANCNLDPNSPNFVARRIGDKYKYYQKCQ